jgi:hypothetical protein
MCSIRAEQCRATELVELAEQIVVEHGDLAAVRAVAAGLFLAGEQRDLAAHVLEPLARGPGLAALPRDWLLPGTLGLLAPVVAATGTPDQCRQLLELLEPYLGQALVLGSGTLLVGPATISWPFSRRASAIASAPTAA